jgi:predicted oxidoreductase
VLPTHYNKNWLSIFVAWIIAVPKNTLPILGVFTLFHIKLVGGASQVQLFPFFFWGAISQFDWPIAKQIEK